MPLGLFGSSNSNGPKPKPLTSEKEEDLGALGSGGGGGGVGGGGGGSASSHHHHAVQHGKELLEMKEHKGSVVKVGKKNYTMERKLAEGGFALVYLVVDKHNRQYALKRQLIKDDPRQLEACRTEAQIVKSLSGHKNIVAHIDHHFTVSKQGVHDYMLLTVYYPNNVLQLMNTRLLASRWLSTAEVLDIFCDVVEAVARLHHSKTPVIHRDLKVENVLIDQRSGSEKPVYVLCDFGSATTKVLAKTTHTLQFMEEEIQRYTTLSYRAPEMIDLYSGVPIDTKSDCWALGVLLYKLCYFTLPFGESALAIQSGQFSFPAQEDERVPDELKAIINLLLTSNAKYRPNIYQTATLSFAAAKREKCPVYNIEKSLRIELTEAVEILHLRERLGANYTRLFEKAFEEFEEACSQQKGGGATGSGGGAAKAAFPPHSARGGIGGTMMKPSPSQLLSRNATAAGMAAGTQPAAGTIAASGERGMSLGDGRRASDTTGQQSLQDQEQKVIEGVIVNTNAPSTSATPSSLTTSVNPRLRPKASAALHHVQSPAPHPSQPPNSQHHHQQQSAAIASPRTPGAMKTASLPRDIPTGGVQLPLAQAAHPPPPPVVQQQTTVQSQGVVIQQQQQQQQQMPAAVVAHQALSSMAAAVHHSQPVTSLRSSAFQPYTIASSQRKAIQLHQQVAAAEQTTSTTTSTTTDNGEGSGGGVHNTSAIKHKVPSTAPAYLSSTTTTSTDGGERFYDESSNPFAAAAPNAVAVITASSMDDTAFGEHFDELRRRNDHHQHSHLPRQSLPTATSTQPHESPSHPHHHHPPAAAVVNVITVVNHHNTNPFIEEEEGCVPTGGGQQVEVAPKPPLDWEALRRARWARDYEEDPFGRAPPPTPQQLGCVAATIRRSSLAATAASTVGAAAAMGAQQM